MVAEGAMELTASLRSPAALGTIAVLAIAAAACSKKRKSASRDAASVLERAPAPEAKRAAMRTIEPAPPEVTAVSIEPALSVLSHHLTGKFFAEAVAPPRRTELGAPFEVPEDAHAYAAVINTSDEVVAWANRNRIALRLPCDRRLPRDLERLDCTGPVMRIAEVIKVSALEWLELSDYEIDAGHISKLERLSALSELGLAACDLADADLEALVRLPKLTHLQLSDNPITDAAMVHVAQLPNLARLDVSRTQLTNGGLAVLSDLETLRFADLSHTEVTDEGLVLLEKNAFEGLRLEYTGVKGSAFTTLTSPRLRALSLRGSWLDDAGLAAIAELSSIEFLWVRGASVTDKGVSHLRKLSNLRILDLGGTEVVGATLEALVALPIEELNLGGLPVGDIIASKLRPMTRLRVLSMTRGRLTDEGMRSITLLPSLEDLWLQRTAVSDDGIEALIGHPRLRKVRPLGSRITRAGCQRLEASGIACAFNR